MPLNNQDTLLRAYQELAQENERLRAERDDAHEAQRTAERETAGALAAHAIDHRELTAEVGRLKGEFSRLSTWLTQRQIELDESNRERDRLRALNAQLLTRMRKALEWHERGWPNCAEDVLGSALSEAQQHDPEYQPIDAERREKRP